MAEEVPTDHIQRIVELSRPGQPLTATAETATINNREWFRRMPGQDKPIPTPDRAELHHSLMAQVRQAAPDVERERKAVVLAGPPGAGKSTVRQSVLGDDDSKYLVIDADDFKEALLTQATDDGSYENWIKPDAVKALESETGEKFYPMELASLVHEESSMLARNLRTDAIERGDNIVIDTVLSDEQGARDLGAMLDQADYDVQVINVEVPYEVSEQRIRDRWLGARREAEQATEQSQDDPSKHLGGRWVPSEYARNVYDGPGGKTKSEHAAHELAETCPAVSRYRVYRSTTEQAQQHQKPTLETDKSRPKQGTSTLVDTAQLKTQQRMETAQSPTPRTARRGPEQGRGRE